jgi:hypothetical protein
MPTRRRPRERLEERLLNLLSSHAERGHALTEPPPDTLVVIEPARIVYTEHWLRGEGYAARQFWKRNP